LLDVGDLFNSSPNLAENKRKSVEARADVYVDAYNMMGHTAMAIGDRDLSLGLETLKRLEKRAKFPFLSANVVDAETKNPVFSESLIVEVDGRKVGLFGLLSNAYRTKANQESKFGFNVLSPPHVTGKVVAEVKEKGAEIIVLLGHLTLEECAELAEEFPEIDAILGSQSQKMKRYPDTVGNTYITDPYMKGKYLGILTLFIHPEEADYVFGDPGRKAALESQVKELEVRIDSRKRALASAKAGEGIGKVRDTSWLEKNLADTEKELTKAKEDLEKAGAESSSYKSFITFDYPPMGKKLEDDGRILKRVENLKKKYPGLAKASK